MKTLLTFVAASTLTATAALAQDAGSLQKMFEAGRYQQVVEAAGNDAPPAALYTAAQSHQKLGANDQAMELYRRLATRPDGDVWHFIGLSGQHLLEGQNDAALEAATEAVRLDGNLADAQYQLGLVRARRQEWREAAAAFDRAAELNPGLAYAHYYGGLMHYRANRLDRMAIHFEQFLELAPDAPERPEVLQIMKTVRGR
jgi:tetratricopeptide (TPR) repeat protein